MRSAAAESARERSRATAGWWTPLRRVPQTRRVGLGVSVFSYAGEVRLGLSADAARVPDPERVIEAFPEELAHLAEVIGA